MMHTCLKYSILKYNVYKYMHYIWYKCIFIPLSFDVSLRGFVEDQVHWLEFLIM